MINDAQVGGRTRKKKATKTNVNPIPRFGETEDEYRPVECKKWNADIQTEPLPPSFSHVAPEL